MTVAAIDRLVHHATILEMNVDSYRRRAAAERRTSTSSPPTTSTDNLDAGIVNLTGVVIKMSNYRAL